MKEVVIDKVHKKLEQELGIKFVDGYNNVKYENEKYSIYFNYSDFVIYLWLKGENKTNVTYWFSEFYLKDFQAFTNKLDLVEDIMTIHINYTSGSEYNASNKHASVDENVTNVVDSIQKYISK